MIHLLRIIQSAIKSYGTEDPKFFLAELVKDMFYHCGTTPLMSKYQQSEENNPEFC